MRRKNSRSLSQTWVKKALPHTKSNDLDVIILLYGPLLTWSYLETKAQENYNKSASRGKPHARKRLSISIQTIKQGKNQVSSGQGEL